jgi:hypothetical protein
MDKHERNKQMMLGPSGIGACPRKIAWQLHFGASDGRRQGYAAGKGVIFHDWLDKRVFAPRGPRFLSNLELPQLVKWVAGGTLDLYDTEKFIVVDFKAPGDPSMEKARRGKPPEDYYIQANTYGLGLVKAGYRVDRVALLYLPMGGNELWSEAKGAKLLTWPFDPQVAVDHLKLVKEIQDALAQRPLHDVMAILPTKDSFCHESQCWTGNRHPEAICHGHRKGGATLRNPENPFDV